MLNPSKTERYDVLDGVVYHYITECGALVEAHGRIDFLAPRLDASRQIHRVHEPATLQKSCDLQAPASHVAQDDDLRLRVQFIQPRRDFVHWNVAHARKRCDSELPGLTYVQ